MSAITLTCRKVVLGAKKLNVSKNGTIQLTLESNGAR
jgi:hypothetical protein